jgi:hypothetical protein
MPKPQADSHDAEAVRAYFEESNVLHLRARKYGALVILESGPVEDPIPHARLRRDTVHLWTLEIATHLGRWEKTGFRALRNELLDLLMTTLPWTIAPIE